MGMLRVLILATAALGATWAAEQIATSAASSPRPVLAQAGGGGTAAEPGEAPASTAAEPADEAAASGADASPAVELEEVSAQEIEAELARIEAAVAGADQDDLGEFTPSKPLVADLPIDMPSDI